MDLLIAADLGTTSIKALVMSSDGAIVAAASKEQVLLTPQPDWVELRLDEYYSAFITVIRECLATPAVASDHICALSLSVQGETLVLVDDAGSPIGNAISWLDNRAGQESEMLRSEFGDEECFKRTGQVGFTPTWPAAKLLWLRRHRPDVLDRAAHVLLLEDFFLHRLSGTYACEPSLVCSTVYWDLLCGGWWSEMLDFLGISDTQLPVPHQSGDPLGPLTAAAAAELGLSENVVVCVGGLDQACAAIGVGNVEHGVVSENTGAALAICATVSEPLFDPKSRMPLHAHAVPGAYMLHTFTSGGIMLRWFRDRLCTEEIAVGERTGQGAYAILSDEASKVPPGCEGLVTLPHLQGAMAPENDPDARAVFVGLSLHHQRAHMVRSIMEAVACAIRRNLDVVSELGVEVSEMRSTGGAAASSLWSQIKADVTGVTTRTMSHQQAASVGAAILAGTGVGVFPSIASAVETCVQPAASYTPRPELAATYQHVYSRYTAVYDALAPVFPTLRNTDAQPPHV